MFVPALLDVRGDGKDAKSAWMPRFATPQGEVGLPDQDLFAKSMVHLNGSSQGWESKR
jgi:hypothetical protein